LIEKSVRDFQIKKKISNNLRANKLSAGGEAIDTIMGKSTPYSAVSITN